MKQTRWISLGVLLGMVAGGALLSPRLAGAQDSAQAAKPAKPEKPKRGGAYLILESEIAAVSQENAFDIIQQLRPSMLRPRAPSGNSEGENGGIVVYVDNMRVGGTEALRTVNRSLIKEIRFLNAGDATQRFGTGLPSGAILVTTVR